MLVQEFEEWEEWKNILNCPIVRPYVAIQTIKTRFSIDSTEHIFRLLKDVKRSQAHNSLLKRFSVDDYYISQEDGVLCDPVFQRRTLSFISIWTNPSSLNIL